MFLIIYPKLNAEL